jgi:predicted MFS family arabinose efflux permease
MSMATPQVVRGNDTSVRRWVTVMVIVLSTFVAPTIAYACFGLGYVLFSTFVVAALEKDAGFGKGHAVWVYALMGTDIATGSLVLGRLSDRLGRRAAMIGSFSSACLAAWRC